MGGIGLSLKKLKGRPSGDEQPLHQEHVLDVSEAEFLANGYSGTSIDAIARKAGVSKLTIYRRFSSKEGLFLSVALRALTDSNHIPSVSADDRPVEEVLTNFATEILNGYIAPRNLAITRLVVGEAPQFPDIARKYHEEAAKSLKPLVNYLRRLGLEGTLSIHDPDRAAMTLTILCMDGIRFLIFPTQTTPEERLAWCREVVRVFMNGHCSLREGE
ncbi:transcriptional regulator (plasmid) [Azospirillum sp. B510]|nr:transcriptional regulator [Azospirillum sp. B510]